jgi:hypothetical protein
MSRTVKRLVRTLVLPGVLLSNIASAQPFQTAVSIVVPHGQRIGEASMPIVGDCDNALCGSPGLPAGLRLLIEHVSAQLELPNRQMAEVSINTTLRTPVGVKRLSHYFIANNFLLFFSQDWYVLSQPTRLYASSGTDVVARVVRSSPNETAIVFITLSGRLEPEEPDPPR